MAEKREPAYLLLLALDFNDDISLCLPSLSILNIFFLAFRLVVQHGHTCIVVNQNDKYDTITAVDTQLQRMNRKVTGWNEHFILTCFCRCIKG